MLQIQLHTSLLGRLFSIHWCFFFAGPKYELIIDQFFQCGFLVDRRQHSPIVIQLLLLSSVLTSFAYFWFVLSPSWTKTPTPGIVSFAIGHGFSPCESDFTQTPFENGLPIRTSISSTTCRARSQNSCIEIYLDGVGRT